MLLKQYLNAILIAYRIYLIRLTYWCFIFCDIFKGNFCL